MRVGIIVWIEIYSQLDLDGHLYTHLAHDFMFYSVNYLFFFILLFLFSRERERKLRDGREKHDRMVRKIVMSCKGKWVQMCRESDFVCGGSKWMTVQAQLSELMALKDPHYQTFLLFFFFFSFLFPSYILSFV